MQGIGYLHLATIFRGLLSHTIAGNTREHDTCRNHKSFTLYWKPGPQVFLKSRRQATVLFNFVSKMFIIDSKILAQKNQDLSLKKKLEIEANQVY